MGCNEDEKTPISIQPEYTISYPGTGVNLHGESNFLAIASEDNGVILLDTTIAHRPIQLGQISLPSAYRVFVQGNHVFVFDRQLGVNRILLENFENLSLQLALNKYELQGIINDIMWYQDSFLFSSETTGVSHYLVDDIRLVGGPLAVNGPVENNAKFLSVVNNHLVSATQSGELTIFSQEGQEIIGIKNWLATSIRVSDMTCHKNYCYLTDLDKGLAIIKWEDLDNPQLLKVVENDLALQYTFIDGNYLYVSYLKNRTSQGFLVYDLGDQENPSLKTNIPTASPVQGMVFKEDVVYILLADEELTVFLKDHVQ